MSCPKSSPDVALRLASSDDEPVQPLAERAGPQIATRVLNTLWAARGVTCCTLDGGVDLRLTAATLRRCADHLDKELGVGPSLVQRAFEELMAAREADRAAS